MNNIKNILVTGAYGQLGSEFKKLSANHSETNFYFAGKEELDITDAGKLRNYFTQFDIDCVLNCAAYTAVDKAEDEREAALEINAEAPAALAKICAENEIVFIHFSTDYVFNGEKRSPYAVSDTTAPLNFYGITKLKGEQAVISFNPEAIVIRTSWLYSSFGKNFVKTMMRLMKEKEFITVVNDQFGSPTYAADLAHATMKIIAAKELHPGIYHYSNRGVISWFDFATEIKNILNSSCRIDPVSTAEYPTPAKRSPYSALDTSKTANTFGLDIPDWKVSLQNCLHTLQDNQSKNQP